MTDILERICAEKRQHIQKKKAEKSLADLDQAARLSTKPRGFETALATQIASGAFGLITEIKKASPSAGVIRPDFSPFALAEAYTEAGATCISVLTDTPYFQGCDQDLITARSATSLPILRKDFMLDPWQVTEARGLGADCILIILAALDDSTAFEIHSTALSYGMDVLIEVHDRKELDRALTFSSGMIGINNRNLKTLKVDLATTEILTPHIPPSRLIVCESGITSSLDIARMQRANAHCFLVGESLLKQSNIKGALKNLINS